MLKLLNLFVKHKYLLEINYRLTTIFFFICFNYKSEVQSVNITSSLASCSVNDLTWL